MAINFNDLLLLVTTACPMQDSCDFILSLEPYPNVVDCSYYRLPDTDPCQAR